jgi:hypothetical protein
VKFSPLTPTPTPTKAAIRRSIKQFENLGFSSHSPAGIVGAHILNYCVENNIGFFLGYLPGGGYSIWKSAGRDAEIAAAIDPKAAEDAHWAAACANAREAGLVDGHPPRERPYQTIEGKAVGKGRRKR